MRPTLGVVVVSRNEGPNLRRTLRCLRATAPRDAEIVVVDDGSTDGSADHVRPGPQLQLIKAKGLGVTKARNLGARRSRGNFVVFSDAHVETPPNWWRPLLTTEWLRRGNALARPAPIVPGCFVAVRREVLVSAGGYDDGMDTWGMSDVEFSIRHWLLGHELWVVPTVEVAHLFRKRHPYEVRWRSVLHNTLRTALVHFNQRRVSRVIDALRHHRDFPDAMSLVSMRKALTRREELDAVRRRDDDWYFGRFGDWKRKSAS